MDITVQGLNSQQRRLADMLWSCESKQDVEQLIRNLPSEYKRDAVTVHQLMIAAVMDGYMEVDPSVKDLISRISHR